ncbi:hypothetical protein BDR07DRAFT_1411399 [Suillus spraguei]|nr:hypothetical protein BDR07DRAFT_1411399 [Suillus spraguei]
MLAPFNNSSAPQPHIQVTMSPANEGTTRMSSDTSINSSSQVPSYLRLPTHPILKSAFEMLCVVAVSRTSLEHWENTGNDEWKEHVRVMVQRFQNSNVTAGLVLATTALLLTSHSPVTSLMDFNTPASYAFTLIAFSTALLSVISGAAVVIIYETSVVHKDMECLKIMSRHQIIFLLLWLAYPPICLAISTCFLFVSLFTACFCSSNPIVIVTIALGCLVFLINGFLTLYVFKCVPHSHAKPTNNEEGSASKDV